MKIIINPTQEELDIALTRPKLESQNLDVLISEVFAKVEEQKDEALKALTLQFDQVEIDKLLVSKEEFEEAGKLVSPELKEAIQVAAQNIERFHRSQISREIEVETTFGVQCWRKPVAIQNVGLYVPGGTAPLFSTVLMLGIPAEIAGCKACYLCTPPNKEGKIHPAILFAAKIAGINTIYKVGGSQAIAAMSLGTETIPKADKIFGPGNQYVTAAKMHAQTLGIAIDMPAGPSEVLVAADNSIPASFVAADLLAQAEHGSDSQVIFLTDDEQYADEVLSELDNQLAVLPRTEIAREALKSSTTIVVEYRKWAEIINSYAPEHLIVMGKYEDFVVENVVNAGSVFIGRNTAESFGDYASGTNHTLPTSGFARSYSGVSLDSFVKKITYQKVSDEGLMNLAKTVIVMAEAEELQGHANAVILRYKSLVFPDSLKIPADLKDDSVFPDVRLSVRNSMEDVSKATSGVQAVFQNAMEDVSKATSGVQAVFQNAMEDVSKATSGVQAVFQNAMRDASKTDSGITHFIRKDLRNIQPYSSAREEFEDLISDTGKLEDLVFLDANENGSVTNYNRYPDPFQKELKKAIAEIKGIKTENLFLGNGSDEVLDLIFRLTTTPFLDAVAYLNPSYGMYEVLARLNGVRTKAINLDENFRIDYSEILLQANDSKLLIICNPNNPTGGVFSKEELLEIVREFKGIVIADEAYIDFCPDYSLAGEVENYSNLIVVQTLSKAYGMAGLRVGMAIASEKWIIALNSIKPPYNLSSLVQERAIQELKSIDWDSVKTEMIAERERLIDFLKSNSVIEKVFPSEANFILFRISDAQSVYDKLIASGVVVRNRSSQYNCSDTLRVSVGTKTENDKFIEIINSL